MLVLVITTFDDNSEYDHVFLHPSSYTFLGLEWEGRYLSILLCHLGWKTSGYIYHSIGLAATSYIRFSGVLC